MQKTIDPTAFLNETVWAKVGVSQIHGVGVIAIRDIKQGTPITDWNVYHHRIKEPEIFEMDEDEFMKIEPEIRSLILDKVLVMKDSEKITFVSPNHEVVLQGFMNHSSDPNTDGHIALRDIAKGEELTENYNTVYEEGLDDISLNHFLPG